MNNDDERSRLKDVEADIFEKMRESSRAAEPINLGIQFDPDAEAKHQDLAAKTGTPVELVREQPDLINSLVNAPDPSALAEESPGTLEFYKDVDNVAIAHDDHENLTKLEKIWNRFETVSGKLTPGGIVRQGRDILTGESDMDFSAAASAAAETGTNILDTSADILSAVSPLKAARYGYHVSKKAWHSYKVGKQNVESGRLHTKKALELIRGNQTPELDRQIKALEGRRMISEEDSNFFETGITAAVEMLPLIFSSFSGGAITGGGYVMAATPFILGLGAAGPQAATPIDEAVAYASIFSAGMTVGALDEIFILESGLALEELLEATDANGNPINPRIAAVAAFGTGSINAGLEFVGLRMLARLIPGGQRLFGKITTDIVKKSLKNPAVTKAMDSLLLKYGTSVVAETTTEMAQEAVNILFTHGAKQVAENVDDVHFIGKEWSAQDWSRVMSAGYEAFSATVFLGLPLVVVKGVTQTRQAQRSQGLDSAINELNEQLGKGHLKDRSPEAQKRHLNTIGAGSEIWIDGQFFQESGEVGKQIAKKLGLDPEQVEKDVADGQDIKTSVDRILVDLAEEEFNQVAKDVKESPGAMTPRQVESLDLNAEAKKIGDKKKEYDENITEINKQIARVKREAIKSGYSERYAKDLTNSLFKRFTKAYGYTPQQQIKLYRKLSIQRAAQDFTQKSDLYQSIVGSEHFKKWFAQSKVVDESGKPLVMYRRGAGAVKADTGYFGKGYYYFTQDAAELGDQIEGGLGNLKAAEPGGLGNPVFVSLKNPYYWPESRAKVAGKAEAEAIADDLKSKGHDGIIINVKPLTDDYKLSVNDQVVVFDPGQAREVGFGEIDDIDALAQKLPDESMREGFVRDLQTGEPVFNIAEAARALAKGPQTLYQGVSTPVKGRFMRGDAAKTAKNAADVVADNISDDVLYDFDQVASVEEAIKFSENVTYLVPVVLDTQQATRWNRKKPLYGNTKMIHPTAAFPHGRDTYDYPGCGRMAWADKNNLDWLSACYGGWCYAEDYISRKQGKIASVAKGVIVQPVRARALRNDIIKYFKRNGLEKTRKKYSFLQIKEKKDKPNDLSISVVSEYLEGARVSVNLADANGRDIRAGVDSDGSAWLTDSNVMDALLGSNLRSLTVFSSAYHAPPPPHALSGRTIINVTVSGWHPLGETLSRLRWAEQARANGWNVILREVVADEKTWGAEKAARYNRLHDALLQTDFFIMQQPLHRGKKHGEKIDGLPGCCKGSLANPYTCDNCEVNEGLGPEFAEYWNIVEEDRAEETILYDKNETFFQATPRAPRFYSKLLEEVSSDRFPTTGTAEQFRRLIKTLVKKGIINQQEIDWIGVNEWLDKRSGKIKKEALSAFIKKDQVEMLVQDVEDIAEEMPDFYEEEEVRDDAFDEFEGEYSKGYLNRHLNDEIKEEAKTAWENPDERHDIWDWGNSKDWYLNKWDDDIDKAYGDFLDDVKDMRPDQIFGERDEDLRDNLFEQLLNDYMDQAVIRARDRWEEDAVEGYRHDDEAYQLPGGENYQEIVFTTDARLPEKFIPGYIKDEIKALKDFNEGLKKRYGKEKPTVSDMTPEEFNQQQILESKARHAEYLKGQMELENKFESGHWENIENVFAHVRATDRTGKKSENIFLIEELQSDWVGKGRKEGFRKYYNELPENYSIKKEFRSDPKSDQFWGVYRDDKANYEFSVRTGPEHTYKDALSLVLDRLNSKRKFSGVPRFAFEENYRLVVMKSLVRMAADRGYDKVAWTTGATQNQRWSLFEKVNKISWNEQDRELLYKRKDDLNQKWNYVNEKVGKNRLHLYIGEELSQKLISKEKDQDGFRDVEGDELILQGKEMVSLYDEILPSITKKFFGKKKWGRPRIGREKIEIPGEDDTIIWSMEITDEMKQKSQREGFALFQQPPDETTPPRGSISFANDQYLINLFQGADPSTAIHESAHVFLRETEGLVNSGLAEDFIIKDHETTRKWLGAEEGQALTKKQNEKFARGFERYLWEGVAPSKDMEGVFARFSAWLRSVYTHIEQLNVELTDEMREVFARMLTQRSELDLAGQLNEFVMPDKSHLDALGVVTEDRNYMQRLIDKAYDVAEIAMGKDRNKKRRKNLAKWKQDAEDAIRIEGNYVFVDEIKKLGGINRQMLIDQYGEDVVKQLPKGVATKKGTIAPSNAVVESIFADPDDMVTTLSQLPPKAQAIKARVAAFDKAHDSQYQPIDYLVETKEYGAFLEIIAKYQDRNNRGVTPQKAFKEYARQHLESKTVREAIRHDRFLAQMKKHARIEADKTRQQKWADAASANEHVRLNFELTAGAVRTRKTVEKTLKRIDGAIKAYHKNHNLNQEHALNLMSLAVRFNLTDPGKLPSTFEDKITLEKIITDQDSAMSSPGAFGALFVNEGNSKDYRDLTVLEIKELYNLIKFLISRGRDQKEQWLFDKTIKAADAANAIYNESADVKKGKKPPLRFSLRSKPGKLIRRYLAELDSLPFIAKSIGGYSDIGWKGTKSLAQKFIIDPLIRAQNEKIILWEQVSEKSQPHINQLVKTARKWRKQYGRRIRISGMDTPQILDHAGQQNWWTQEQILSVILNLGNQGNIDRLYAGYGGMDEPGGLSETTVERMKDMLTKEDWDAVQGIWDVIDSLYPQTNKVHERIYGYSMDKVEPVPVQTKFGTLKGGYYPIIYDGSLAQKASLLVGKWEEADALLNSSEAVRQVPSTKSGFVKKRAGANVRLPLKLSMGVVTTHLMDTVHYVTHAQAVHDVDRLTRQQPVIDATVRIIGKETYDMIRPALKHIARPRRDVSGNLHQWIEALRKVTIPFILGWNASVAVKQWFSTPAAWFEIGLIDYVRGAASSLSSPLQTYQFMKEVSPYMRQRATNLDRELHDQFKALSFKQLTSIYGPVIPKWEFLRNAGFWPIRTMDMITVIPIWSGAYQREFRKSGDVQKAVDFADYIVRKTQPSAQPLDLNQWQRLGGAYRALSMFQTFTVGKYGNRQRLHYRAMMAGKMNPMDFAFYLLADAIVPAASMVTVLALLQGRDLDDEFIEEMPTEILKYTLFTGMPVVSGFWSQYSGPLDSPISIVGDVGKRVIRLGDKAINNFGELEDEEIIMNLIDVGSLMSGIPASRVYSKAKRGAKQEDRSGLKYLFPTPKKYQ